MSGSRKYKKHDALLNFSVGSQQRQPPSGGGGGGGATRRPHRGPGNSTSTKQGFVLSNFRLGVIENEPELSACSAEASSLISWAKVLQVTSWGSFEDFQCPICLSPPRCARLTQCGHIFCLPCLLEHRRHCSSPAVGSPLTSGAPAKKTLCPICKLPMYLNALKSVCMVPVRGFKKGDTVQFTLVRRPKNSVLCFTAEDAAKGYADGGAEFAYNEAPRYGTGSSRHSRYYGLPVRAAVELLDRDEKEVLMALEDLFKVSESASGFELEELEAEQGVLLQSVDIVQQQKDAIVTQSLADPPDSEEGTQPWERPAPSGAARPRNAFAKAKQADGHGSAADDCYSFYQSADGQHVYLSPLCLRMLHHTAGVALEWSEADLQTRLAPWHTLPQQLEVVLDDDLTFLSQDAQTHARYRYLSNLPFGTPFATVHVDLKDVVSAETSAAFAHQVVGYRKKREQQRLAEDAELRRAQKAADRARKLRYQDFWDPAEADGVNGGEAAAAVSLGFDDLAQYPALATPPAAAPQADYADPNALDLDAEADEVSSGGGEEPPPDAKVVPRRIDPSDGKPYTREQFDDFYGIGCEDWHDAIEAAPLVLTKSFAEIQQEERLRSQVLTALFSLFPA
ncbi:putative RING finger protein P8B7.23 [Diplonema papillatum]|nr:putative RING finger protein P8B7.23 [Diplonema papillatum]